MIEGSEVEGNKLQNMELKFNPGTNNIKTL